MTKNNIVSTSIWPLTNRIHAFLTLYMVSSIYGSSSFSYSAGTMFVEKVNALSSLKKSHLLLFFSLWKTIYHLEAGMLALNICSSKFLTQSCLPPNTVLWLLMVNWIEFFFLKKNNSNLIHQVTGQEAEFSPSAFPEDLPAISPNLKQLVKFIYLHC